jgi:hypothetical protein
MDEIIPEQIKDAAISKEASVVETVNAKSAVTLICVGIILAAVSVPLYLGKIKKNYFYGFRIRKAFESDENWYLINRYGAGALMCWSVIIVAVGIACLYIDPRYVLAMTNAAFISLLVPIVLTLFYAKKL